MSCWFKHARFLILPVLLLLTWHSTAGQNKSSGDGGPSDEGEVRRASTATAPVQSEIGVSYLDSFGHFRLYAASIWDSLRVTEIDYERNSWGRALGARMDYSAAFEPAVLLWQPTHTDTWAGPNPKGSKDQEMLFGMGVAPIGLRMMWFNERRVKPYFLTRGGLVGFDKKAISQYASYLNMTLQIGVGAQFRISPRLDAHAGISYYHISNAFMVPSNPGLDSMTYRVGISYWLKRNVK
jgi:Lipid A 3-O-deacylase (PagL)